MMLKFLCSLRQFQQSHLQFLHSAPSPLHLLSAELPCRFIDCSQEIKKFYFCRFKKWKKKSQQISQRSFLQTKMFNSLWILLSQSHTVCPISSPSVCWDITGVHVSWCLHHVTDNSVNNLLSTTPLSTVTSVLSLFSSPPNCDKSDCRVWCW